MYVLLTSKGVFPPDCTSHKDVGLQLICKHEDTVFDILNHSLYYTQLHSMIENGFVKVLLYFKSDVDLNEIQEMYKKCISISKIQKLTFEDANDMILEHQHDSYVHG